MRRILLSILVGLLLAALLTVPTFAADSIYGQVVQFARTIFAGGTNGQCWTYSNSGMYLGAWESCAAGGTIGGTIADTQVAVGSGTDEIGGSAALTFDGTTFSNGGNYVQADTFSGTLSGFQRYRGHTVDTVIDPSGNLPGGTSVFATWNTLDFEGTHDIAQGSVAGVYGFFNHSGNSTAIYGHESDLFFGGSSGTIGTAYAAYNFIENDAGQNITTAYASLLSPVNIYGAGTITSAYGAYVTAPIVDSAVTVTDNYAFWAGAQGNAKITNSYGLWLDEQGVFRIKSDNTFNSVYQAIPALYNPQFTKYIAGAANYERIVYQWESNVAVLTTEAGGTGTLRSLQLGDANVPILVSDLKNTGAAGSKKVVCVDTSTGRLYASSTGTDCSN